MLELVEDLGIVDDDELRGRLAQPAQKVSDGMQLEMLEVGVAPRLGRDFGHVELIADVAVHPEAFVREHGDRLAGELERDRLVPEPPPAHRLGHDRALVADDGILDARLERVRPDRLEHTPRDEDDVDSRRPRCRDHRLRARAQHPVLADQRAVEVAGHGPELAREVVREVQPCGFVRKSTSAVRSPAGRDAYDLGMTPFG